MISIEEKIYTLSYLWKEAEYNFAFWAMIPEIDWDKTYREYLKLVIDSKDDFEFFCLIKRFFATLKDGHTCVNFPNDLLKNYKLPIYIDYFDGDFILSGVPIGQEQQLNKKIISFNGILIDDFINEYLFPNFWHEVPMSLYKSGAIVSALIIAFRDKNEIVIETETGSIKIGLHDNREVTSSIYNALSFGKVTDIFSGDSCKISVSEDNICIISIPAFYSSDLVDDVISYKYEINKTKAIIIDVRGNQGGMGATPYELAQLFFGGEYVARNDFKTPSHNAQLHALEPYLDEAKIDTDEWKHKQIYQMKNHTYYETEDNETVNFNNYDTVFNQQTILLTDWDTACAAEEFVDYFKMSNRALTVGSTTYGSGSEAMIRELPCGAKMWLGTTWSKLCSGKEYVNIGIEPDIYVENSLEDVINGNDRVMKTAIDIINNKI